MPQYLILKLEGDDPRAATIVSAVSSDDPAVAIKQGFTGAGRYAIVDWDERLEANLELGPVKVEGIQDKAARAELDSEGEKA